MRVLNWKDKLAIVIVVALLVFAVWWLIAADAYSDTQIENELSACAQLDNIKDYCEGGMVYGLVSHRCVSEEQASLERRHLQQECVAELTGSK